MSEPLGAIDLAGRREEVGRWAARLVIFLRIMAGISMLKGLYHWAEVLGIGAKADAGFDTNPITWQVATVFFAVIDLVAAVGLWLAAAWGGVVWLTAAISMAALELFFPEIFGGRVWVSAIEAVMVFAYVIFALMAARERPT